jgi:cob(I)alamin adenosyltransferase
MQSMVNELVQANPTSAILLTIVLSSAGTGGIGVYSASSNASEQYVDTEIAKVTGEVKEVNESIQHLKLTFQYESARGDLRVINKEVFQLEQVQATTPQAFSVSQGERLHTLRSDLRAVEASIADLRIKLLNTK